MYLSGLLAFSGTWICTGKESAHKGLGHGQLAASEKD